MARTFTIRGRVRVEGDAAAGPVRVIAIDRDMRHEQVLGDAHVDREGRFEIAFSDDQFRRAEKDAADVVFRVVSDEGATLPIARLEVNGAAQRDPASPLFNAAQDLEVLLL